MTTNIIVNFSLEGFHYWKDAKDIFPEVSFLSDPHRHTFTFCCKKSVSHDDRDIEIIKFKREIMDYLYFNYGVGYEHYAHYQHLDFGQMSCEMIAKELVNKFQLTYCSVLEDHENGAEVFQS